MIVSGSKRWNARFASCARRMRFFAKPAPGLLRRSSTAHSSDDRLHRRASCCLWGQADLQGSADRPIHLPPSWRRWAKVCAESSRSLFRDAVGRWRDVEEASRFRYVGWVGARGFDGPRHAPPLRMRCWYEVVIATAKGRRTVLREEGLRGDDARTADRAIGRWGERQGKETGEPVAVREFRIARRQPRPMPADG